MLHMATPLKMTGSQILWILNENIFLTSSKVFLITEDCFMFNMTVRFRNKAQNPTSFVDAFNKKKKKINVFYSATFTHKNHKTTRFVTLLSRDKKISTLFSRFF